MRRIELNGGEYIVKSVADCYDENYTRIECSEVQDGLNRDDLNSLYGTIYEELYDNTNNTNYSLDEYCSVFLKVNNYNIRVGCPGDIGLSDRCHMSCKNCWITAINERVEAKRIRDDAKNLFEKGLIKEPKVITNISSREEKVSFLNGLKTRDELHFRLGKAFVSNSKLYFICPSYVGLDGEEGVRDKCNRNCKECWKNNIREYLEGEE